MSKDGLLRAKNNDAVYEELFLNDMGKYFCYNKNHTLLNEKILLLKTNSIANSIHLNKCI